MFCLEIKIWLGLHHTYFQTLAACKRWPVRVGYSIGPHSLDLSTRSGGIPDRQSRRPRVGSSGVFSILSYIGQLPLDQSIFRDFVDFIIQMRHRSLLSESS